MAGRLSARAGRALRRALRRKRPRPCGLQQLTSKTTKRPKIDWAAKPTKRQLNTAFIPFAVQPDTASLVIDASNLGTTTECRKVHPDADIHVLNGDPKIAEKANQMGHTGHAGISTDVLPELVRKDQKFGLAYFDYCGTPDGNQLGFKPSIDVGCIPKLLHPDAATVITFSRRTKRSLEKARRLFDDAGLKVLCEHKYRDTSNMVVYLLAHIMSPRLQRQLVRAFKTTVMAA